MFSNLQCDFYFEFKISNIYLDMIQSNLQDNKILIKQQACHDQIMPEFIFVIKAIDFSGVFF